MREICELETAVACSADTDNTEQILDDCAVMLKYPLLDSEIASLKAGKTVVCDGSFSAELSYDAEKNVVKITPQHSTYIKITACMELYQDFRRDWEKDLGKFFREMYHAGWHACIDALVKAVNSEKNTAEISPELNKIISVVDDLELLSKFNF
jgi:hypothetical protein